MRFDDSLNQVFPTTSGDIENQRDAFSKTTVAPVKTTLTNVQGTYDNDDSTQNGYMYQVDLHDNKENELGHNALVAYQYSKGVKYSAIIAFFMNLSLVLFNSYYVFFSLCALWGYYTTLQYKPYFSLSYFVYLLLNLIIRTSISVYDCVNQFDAGDNVYGGLNITLTFFLFVMSIYGIRMAWRVYFYLSICEPEERIQLRNMRRLNLKALCW
jgi:hypothetical protein